MNHTFLSHRSEIIREQEIRELLLDVKKLSNISDHDHKLIQRRREADVEDDELREILERRGNRLGHLIEDIERISGHDLSNERSDWEKFCNGESIMLNTLDSMLEESDATVSKLADMEIELSESSLSDYSDSTSDSEEESHDSDGDEEDEEDDDEEEEEEDDDD